MLQVLKVHLGQRSSFTGMKDGSACARAEHMSTARGVAGCKNCQLFPKFLPCRFNMSSDCQLTVSAIGEHVIQVAERSCHLKLIRFDLNQALSGLPSIVRQ